MSRFLAMSVAAITLLFSNVCRSDTDAEKEAKTTSPYIVKVEAFGTWGIQGDDEVPSGFIRYVVLEGGYEEINDTLVIQWISVSRDEDEKIVATVQIPGTALGVFHNSITVTENPYVLHLTVDSLICREPQQYEVHITDIGKYTLKYLNKKPCDGT